MRTYDPYQLITQARTLLGTVPVAADNEKLALTGACMLLRGLGIVPAAEESWQRAALRDSRTSAGTQVAEFDLISRLKLRLNVEAPSHDAMTTIRDEVLALVR